MPASNLWGGVEATGVQSSRDVYAEQSVWSANQQSGFSSSQSASLNQLQQIFDVTGQKRRSRCSQHSLFRFLRLEFQPI